MRTKLWPVTLILLLAACNKESNEDETTTVDHSGSVETSVSVQHADSTHDVLLTRHKIWYNNLEFKTVEYKDTVPALGMLNTDAENSSGDTQPVKVKKDYQIFITVK